MAVWSLCVCVRAYVHACTICVGNDAKEFEWYVAVYLGNLAGFHCAFGPVYVLLTLMFFYCARQVVWQIHFYITLQYLSLAVMQAVHLYNPVPAPTSYPEKKMANMVMNFTPVLFFTYQIDRASTLWGMTSLHLKRELAVHNARACRSSLKMMTRTRYLFTSCVFAEACQVVSCKAMSLKLVSRTFQSQ